MAAESAVLVAIGTSLASALLKPVLQKSADALSKSDSAAGLKSAILGNLGPQLLDLKRELRKLDEYLSCAENLNPMQHNRNNLLLLWLENIKEASTFADNLLEDICYDRLRRQAESNKVVAKLFSGSDGTSPKFRRKIGSKLSKFKSMTCMIYKEAADIGLRPVEVVANPARDHPPAAMSADLREIRENPDASIVVGRQLDEELIVGELSRTDNVQVLGVVAIVGMSGVGKTTLARKIYDNATVTEHYKKKTWIFVSHDFDLRRLLNEMLECLTGVNHNLTSIEAMERKLQGCLEEERYLVVLDDVWNTNEQIWYSIRTSLVRVTDGCTCSMVLVTTQSYQVASVMGAYVTRTVNVLSKDDAWKLFEKNAFANKSHQQVSDLRDIGVRILRKCGGLPLAINTLASLLGSMNKRSEWESVETSEVWKLPEGQTKIMPWLLLSFNHLPNATTKQCFAQCSVLIPKGRSIWEEILIRTWTAHGFIQPEETSYQCMMDTGRLCIKFLLASGLLQFNYRNNRLFMHDLIHDLAMYVSKDKCLIVSDPKDLHTPPSGVEHVRICGIASNSQLNFPNIDTQSTLRTLFCFNATISIDLVVQARFLRQLLLVGCGLKEIPKSIGRLKFLRILGLGDNPIEYLPETIGRLYNLQSLYLSGCSRLVELPQQVTKLFNLRVISTSVAVHIPKGMGQLTCLEALPVVKLKAGDGCKIKELKNLQHLTGQVHIMQLENMHSKEDAVEAGLKSKAGITHLRLSWTSDAHAHDAIFCSDEEVMDGLQPHSSFENLMVENFRGKRFSPWLSNELYCNNLIDLKLVNCKRCEQLPTLGSLPSLKFLAIDRMESVDVIGRDFLYRCDETVAACSNSVSSNNEMSKSKLFPQLKSFSLWNMLKLKDWYDPSGSCASAFPCMEGLYITNCPSLVSAPSCFHSLRQLTFSGVNSGQPLLMILSNSYNLTSLVVEDVQQLTSLSEPLLKCTCLRLLRIRGCKELVEFPPTLQSLRYLQTLEVKDCDSCEQLPTLGHLPSLKSISIGGMKSVKVIGSNFFYACDQRVAAKDVNLFPQLKEFSLSNMRELEEWFDPSGTCASAFTCLEKLSIRDCPSLVSGPYCFQSLQQLNIKGIESAQPLLMILSNSYNLTSLTIEGVRELTCLSKPLLKCTSLRQLCIKHCQKLVELPPTLQSLGRLQKLEVGFCDSLTSFPDIRGLLSLCRLDIINCENITNTPCGLESCVSIENLYLGGCPEFEMPDLAGLTRLRNLGVVVFPKQMSVPRWLNHLSNLSVLLIGGFNKELDHFGGIDQLPKCLRTLRLAGWPKLKSLPKELQSFNQLQTLHLWGFDGVIALPEWLGNLSSLQSLQIRNCINMKNLPSLDAMGRLAQLRELVIKGCPGLKESCTKDIGEEWHKISHIPSIRVDQFLPLRVA